jgi:2-keto-4-pentenoate hydratase/2-oxohepta-3-ene-1,7-dioic acid hydratase in catechol pathway
MEREIGMKVVTFENGQKISGGILANDRIYPLEGATDVLAFIESGSTGQDRMKKVVAEGKSTSLPIKDVRLLAPLLNPPRIFGVGLNYVEHADESPFDVQAVPTVFLKLSSSITGPDTEVPLPPNATEPDYEAELAVVIGRSGHNIPAAEWKQYIFGYTILNDVSARDVQFATTQWTLGKSFPGFTPLGPWIVTSDEIPDPHALDIRLTLSGEVMQNANTRDQIFKIPRVIEYISSIVPLQAGDIISTGTPPGVGLGRKPQRWLRPNEEMIIEIEKIGALRNRTLAVTA